MKKNKDIFSIDGYKSTSKDRKKLKNVIPSGRITMKDVPHPVYGIDDMGNEMMMYPGNEYIFPGNMVTEYPIRQMGGGTPNWNINNAITDPNKIAQFKQEKGLIGNEGSTLWVDPTTGGYTLFSPTPEFSNHVNKPINNSYVPPTPPPSIGGFRSSSTGIVLPDRGSSGQVDYQYPQYLDEFASSPQQVSKIANQNSEIETNKKLLLTMTEEQKADMRAKKMTPQQYLNSSTTASMKHGGENHNTWDPQFYENKRNKFMDWIKNSAKINSPETNNYLKQVGGVVNSRAYGVGRVYSSPYDQPISPDIYGDPEFDNRNTTIGDTNYGREQATIDYSTTGVKTQQPFNQQGVPYNEGNQVPGNYNTTAVNWNYSPTPSLENQQEPMMIDPNAESVNSRDQIFMDYGRAKFDRNKPLEKDLKKQEREKRKNSVSGETKANILLSGLNFVNNLARQDEQSRYEEQLQRQYSAENLFNPVTGYRGDYLLNPQGSNFRTNNYSYGNYGKIYQQGGEYKSGGEYEMTDEELLQFIANGGEVEYLD